MNARRVIFGLILLLALAHQDFCWWYEIDPMVFGFIPIGLAYHALVSITAAILWGLAVLYCWPDDVDVLEEPGTQEGFVRDGDRS